MNKNTNPSIYIHFPWCEVKCPYCDFNSFPIESNYSISQDSYLQKLLTDLDNDFELFGNPKKFASIFIGGGTPTLIRDDILASLLEKISKKADISNTEITIEANPNSLLGRAKFLKSIGITRISIGCQSFDNKFLTRLGRIHSGKQAELAIDESLAAGLDVNADLIYSLPSQGVDDAMSDLKIALDFPIHHLSWYQLTLEQGTLFARKPPKNIPNDDLNFEIMEAGLELLDSKGFHRYEISAYSKKNYQCQHNLNYWKFGDYLGIGAGAHGKLNTATGIIRTEKPNTPKNYLSAIASIEKITDEAQLQFEILLNGLRLIDGFEVSVFDKFNIKPPYEKLDKYFQQDFLTLKNGILAPTKSGLLWINEILMDFL